jgi:hypothetical protein
MEFPFGILWTSNWNANFQWNNGLLYSGGKDYEFIPTNNNPNATLLPDISTTNPNVDDQNSTEYKSSQNVAHENRE